MSEQQQAQHAVAIDSLQSMFAGIERSTIANILINECQGDTTKSIVLLTKIQQFNAISQKPDPNITAASGGEATNPAVTVVVVPPSQCIPLQVAGAPAVVAPDDCCGAGCGCCAMKPASYKPGLYPIDMKIHYFSFILFALITGIPECTMDGLSYAPYGFYLPTAGLALVLCSSVYAMSSANPDKRVGYVTMLAAALFCVGNAINMFNAPGYDYYRYYYYYDWWAIPDWETFLGRGVFVSSLMLLVGYLQLNEKKLPDSISGRKSLIQFYSVLFIVYQVTTIIEFPYLGIMVVMGGAPFVLIIALLVGCCTIKQSDEAGGCSAGLSIGLVVVVAFYIQLVFTLMITFGWFWYDDKEFVVWEAGYEVFAAFQMWIMSRAMHPANANCGCTQDGSGDGGVVRQTAVTQQQAAI